MGGGDGKQSPLSVFGRKRRAQIGCERGNAALSRLVVSHKRNASWQRQFARFRGDMQICFRIWIYAKLLRIHHLRERHHALLSTSDPSKNQENNNDQ